MSGHATVVKCHSFSAAIDASDISINPFVIVTAYLLFRFKGDTGVNLMVVLLSVKVILPCTGPPLESSIRFYIQKRQSNVDV